MIEILCLDNPNDDVPYLDKQQEKQAKEMRRKRALEGRGEQRRGFNVFNRIKRN